MYIYVSKRLRDFVEALFSQAFSPNDERKMDNSVRLRVIRANVISLRMYRDPFPMFHDWA